MDKKIIQIFFLPFKIIHFNLKHTFSRVSIISVKKEHSTLQKNVDVAPRELNSAIQDENYLHFWIYYTYSKKTI